MSDTTERGCAQVEQLLADALAAGQPCADSAVREHLAVCDRCRRYEAQLGELMKTLDEDPVPDPGEAYWQQFTGRVQQRLEKRPRRRWPVWAGVAAAAALLLFLVWLPDPPTGPVPAGTQTEGPPPTQPEGLRCLLNDLLGQEEALDLSGESWDSTDWELTPEEQEALLESLRAEMRNPA